MSVQWREHHHHRHRLTVVAVFAWLTCTIVACGAASEPPVFAAHIDPTAQPAPTTVPLASDDAAQTVPTTLPAAPNPTTLPKSPEVAPSIDTPAIGPGPSEHVLDQLLPSPADLPDGWTYARSDESSGESAQDDCPGSAEFAEFLGWMRRKVVSTDPSGELEVAVGHADVRANDVLGTLAGVTKLELCRATEEPDLRFQVLDADSDVGELLVAFEVTLPEGRLVWVGAVLQDGLVATAQFGTPPAPAGDESLAELLAQIALVESRRPAAVDLRLRCEGRFGPGPLRDVDIDELESCDGYREWAAQTP